MACHLLVMGVADRVSMANDTQHAKPMGLSAAYTAPPRLRPTQAQMGPTRNHSTQSRHAGRGLSDDCASLQSAVEVPETNDGE